MWCTNLSTGSPKSRTATLHLPVGTAANVSLRKMRHAGHIFSRISSLQTQQTFLTATIWQQYGAAECKNMSPGRYYPPSLLQKLSLRRSVHHVTSTAFVDCAKFPSSYVQFLACFECENSTLHYCTLLSINELCFQNMFSTTVCNMNGMNMYEYARL